MQISTSVGVVQFIRVSPLALAAAVVQNVGAALGHFPRAIACKLRKKLANASNGKDYIETVWGRGYALREPSEYEAESPA